MLARLEYNRALGRHCSVNTISNSRVTLAYIASPSFSGSTLLTFLLAGHPDIATVGELKCQALGDVDHYDCSCGTRIRDCPFWSRLQRRLAERGTDFRLDDFGTHFRCRTKPVLDRILRARVRGPAFEHLRRTALRLVPGGRRLVRDRVEHNARIIEQVMDMRNARIFLDASKDPVRAEYLIESGRFDVFIIHLIRDGRGTAYSYMRHDGMTMADATREWKRTHAECSRLLRLVPAIRGLVVRYEDLCADPGGTVAGIVEFLGLAPHPLIERFQSVEHHIVGNAMRLTSSGQIRLDEKWRTLLTREELHTFERVVGRPYASSTDDKGAHKRVASGR